MSIKPPITDLPIETDSSGFYAGFNKIVALGSKILIRFFDPLGGSLS